MQDINIDFIFGNNLFYGFNHSVDNVNVNAIITSYVNMNYEH